MRNDVPIACGLQAGRFHHRSREHAEGTRRQGDRHSIFLVLLLLVAAILGVAEATTQSEELSQHGIQLARQGEFEAAAEVFRSATQLDPTDGRLYLHLANAYLELSSFDEAVDVSQKAIELLPESAEAHATLGQIHHRRGNALSAIPAYQTAIRLSGDKAEYHYDLGSAFHSLGKFEEAEKAYREALRCDPKLGEVHHNLGEIYNTQGRLDEAIEAYEKALETLTESQYTRKQLGKVRQKRKERLEREIQRYQSAVALHPEDAQSYRQLALAYFSNRQLKEAIEALRIVLYLQPDSEQAQFDLSSVLRQQEHSLNEALELNRAKLQEQPQNPGIHHTLGVIYLSKEQPELAAKHFRQALESAPDSAVTWLKLGETLQMLSGGSEEQMVEDARQAYQQAIQRQPSFADAHRLLGVLERNAGHFSLAVEHLQAAATAAPEDAQIHHDLGMAYRLVGNPKEARTEYHTAIRLKPDMALAHLRLAEIYAEEGKAKTAISSYQRFIGMAKPRVELHELMRKAESERAALEMQIQK